MSSAFNHRLEYWPNGTRCQRRLCINQSTHLAVYDIRISCRNQIRTRKARVCTYHARMFAEHHSCQMPPAEENSHV